MPRYKLIVEYDGGFFSGWQRQENGPSIQGAIEDAVFKLTTARTLVQGAGRTDAGVHATGQVAHVDLVRAWDGFKLREALNAHLVGLPIAVIAAEGVAADFDARRSAVYRRYVYRILNRRAPPALERRKVWHVKRALDSAAMAEAARVLVGRHDFTTFRDTQCQASSPVRTLDAFNVVVVGEELRCEVGARSFLHRQVRSMVGSLVEVGFGKWSAADLKAALDSADRSRCGPVAPSDGLYLTGVDYP